MGDLIENVSSDNAVGTLVVCSSFVVEEATIIRLDSDLDDSQPWNRCHLNRFFLFLRRRFFA